MTNKIDLNKPIRVVDPTSLSDRVRTVRSFDLAANTCEFLEAVGTVSLATGEGPYAYYENVPEPTPVFRTLHVDKNGNDPQHSSWCNDTLAEARNNGVWIDRVPVGIVEIVTSEHGVHVVTHPL